MRDRGLIDFSGNYEPQMAAPLDGRVRVALKQYLYLPETWASNDGSSYTYKGMAVAVYGDTSSNNGMYILVKDDYTLPDAWINPVATSASGVTVLTIADISELDTVSLEQGIYLVRGAVYGQLTVVDMDTEKVSYFGELSNFNCAREGIFYTGELSSFTCTKLLNLKPNLITASFEGHVVTVHSSSPVASPVTVGVAINDVPSMLYTTIPTGSSSNVLDTVVPVTSVEVTSVDPEMDSEYDYYFTILE